MVTYILIVQKLIPLLGVKGGGLEIACPICGRKTFRLSTTAKHGDGSSIHGMYEHERSFYSCSCGTVFDHQDNVVSKIPSIGDRCQTRVGSRQCSTCGGDGKVDKPINCKHGKSSSQVQT